MDYGEQRDNECTIISACLANGLSYEDYLKVSDWLHSKGCNFTSSRAKADWSVDMAKGLLESIGIRPCAMTSATIRWDVEPEDIEPEDIEPDLSGHGVCYVYVLGLFGLPCGLHVFAFKDGLCYDSDGCKPCDWATCISTEANGHPSRKRYAVYKVERWDNGYTAPSRESVLSQLEIVNA